MAAPDNDQRPVVVGGLSSIPQINLQSDSPDLSRSASFQPHPEYDSSTPTTDGLTGTEKTQGGRNKKPQFVARDGAIGGKSHNETNVE